MLSRIASIVPGTWAANSSRRSAHAAGLAPRVETATVVRPCCFTAGKMAVPSPTRHALLKRIPLSRQASQSILSASMLPVASTTRRLSSVSSAATGRRITVTGSVSSCGQTSGATTVTAAPLLQSTSALCSATVPPPAIRQGASFQSISIG